VVIPCKDGQEGEETCRCKGGGNCVLIFGYLDEM
jgi:hypothetical protein